MRQCCLKHKTPLQTDRKIILWWTFDKAWRCFFPTKNHDIARKYEMGMSNIFNTYKTSNGLIVKSICQKGTCLDCIWKIFKTLCERNYLSPTVFKIIQSRNEICQRRVRFLHYLLHHQFHSDILNIICIYWDIDELSYILDHIPHRTNDLITYQRWYGPSKKTL